MTGGEPGAAVTNHQRVDPTQKLTNRVGVAAHRLIDHRVDFVICFYHRSSTLPRYILPPLSVRTEPRTATARAVNRTPEKDERTPDR